MIRFLSPSRALVAALGALVLSGCDNPVVSIDGHTGVPLAQLKLTGQNASEVTLLGPDIVTVVHGDKLRIHVEGDPRAAAALRFVLTDGKLGIGRKPDADAGSGTAIVIITDPSVDHLVMAGSGTISSDRLDGAAVGVTIGGSGRIVASNIAAGKLDVEVLGSGGFTGSGHADKLALSLAGSGSADMARLKADQADIDLAGTGNGDLASDGHVSGSVVGTGTIRVNGKARCDVSVTGTGKVICQPG
jgi:hypothetical protein